MCWVLWIIVAINITLMLFELWHNHCLMAVFYTAIASVLFIIAREKER
jgi:hypothetical protein